MASSATGTSSIGTFALITNADYVVGQFYIAFPGLRAQFPRSQGWYYAMASDLSGANPVFVVDSGRLYSPGVFRKIALPSPGATWKLAIVATFDAGGIPYEVVTV